MQAILERKHQLILYGPPGTGKTFFALKAARELAARSAFKQPYAVLTQDQVDVVHRAPDGLIHLITFHPDYGYENFIEGYRPTSINGNMFFELRDGVFKRLCKLAAAHPEHRFFLIIDEINRGDIPRIFGEVLTLLEKDKRGQQVELPVSGEHFWVPANLFVIGTMNTADRSIALLDTALRRRFGFLELVPDSTLLGNVVIEGIPLGLWLDELNRRIVEFIGRDARNLQVGHAYLMENGEPISTLVRFACVLQEDIIPLLEEYCYEDYSVLEHILGEGLVDTTNQRIRRELFSPGREAQLIQALLEPTPELTTTVQSTFADETTSIEPLDEEEEVSG
jgi:5-methylcytosine-specific restriction protein B